MRKITNDAAAAFYRGVPFKMSNTHVEVNGEEVALFLHGNCIAKRDQKNVYITMAGWCTNTTKERLKGISPVNICTKNGQLYLNGEPWDGEWIKVN